MAIPEITALFSSIKTAHDLVKSLCSLKVEKETAKVLMDTLKVLLSVQSDAYSVLAKCDELVKTKETLEKKIAECDQWTQTESQYKLEEIHRGLFVYTPKHQDEHHQPNHWLCANCWQERKKSILQAEYHHDTAAAYTCQRCKAKIAIQFKPDSPMFVRKERKWDAY